MLPGNYAIMLVMAISTTLVATASILSEEGTVISNTGLQELIDEDLRLNSTRDTARTSISQYLNSGDEQKGRLALNKTHMYLDGRKIWLQKMESLSADQEILSDGTSLKTRNGDLNDVEITGQAVQNIYELSSNFSFLEDLHVQFLNLSGELMYTYDYYIGVESLSVTIQYLRQLEFLHKSTTDLHHSPFLHKPNSTLVPSWIRHFPDIEEILSHLNQTRLSLNEQEDLMMKLKVNLIYRDYIDPPVYLIVLSTGLIWNVVLLVMFAQKREIRTAANIMIFNIVIADVLNLMFNLPLQYFGYYYPSYVRLSEPMCVLFITLRCMFTSASALSVVALSAQRFCATLSAFHNLRTRSRISSLTITILYILFVWTAASSIVLPDTLGEKVCDDDPSERKGRKSAKIVSLHEFLVYCFALPGVMFIFTFLTARRLRQSAKDIPGDVRHKTYEDARHRGAKVVTALCIVFTISYVPFFMWGRIATLLQLDRWEIPYRTLDNITYYLLFSNPCFNPLALYVTSNTFRKLFNNYLFGFCIRRRQLLRTDTQISYDTTQSSRQQESDI